MDNFLRQTAAGQATDSLLDSAREKPPHLSGYTTHRLLGVGSSATVWLVEDQRTGTDWALKIPAAAPGIAGSDADGSSRHAQLDREVAVLGALNHPHLLGLRGVIATDRGPGILADYAAGGSLLNLVHARGRLSIGEVITVLAPIAQAVAYLHSSSVLHGDVSPGNVLFSAEGKPLLADLGISRLLGEPRERISGTAGFTEGPRGRAQATGHAADVYSLAALGWYALTGSPPGQARDRAPLTLLVPDVPAELLSILEACLHDDPRERPSAGELADAVLRSAAPIPLDLVAAVHPSVLPELLTRHVGGDQLRDPRRRLSPAIRVLRGVRCGRGERAPRAGAVSGTSRRARRRAGSRAQWRAAPAKSVAAVLVLCGTLLALPHILPSADYLSDGGRQQPVAAGGPDSPADPPEGVDLSSAMEERLAHAEPVTALSALVTVRAMAMSTGDAGLLAHVNIEDSDAMAADRLLLAGLQESGYVFNGLNIRLQGATELDSIAVPAGAAAVAATAVLSGYTETDSAGAAVRNVAAPVPQDLIFILVRQDDRWKIARVHNSGSV